MKLTNENYFSPEASMEYFGVSQLKAFNKCEAAALAECKGEYKPASTTALLVGSFVDAYFEGTVVEFANDHPEMFKKDGDLRADFKHALDVIERLEADDLFMEYMSGEKQVIKTGEINGHKFKIKIDSYHAGDKIVDLKIVRSLERISGKSFVDFWDYNLQGAVYQMIEGNNLPFYLAAGTKEDPPDLEVIQLEQDEMDASLKRYLPKLDRWAKIKKGEIEPIGCGVCPYCRTHKKLTEPIPAGWVGFNNYEIRMMKGERND